eukprot:PITA_03864
MVVVDRLRKVVHFIPMKTTYSASEVARVFIREIVRPHGVPKKILSDKDANFTSKFRKELFAGLGIRLAFSTAYHPQTNDIEQEMKVIKKNLKAAQDRQKSYADQHRVFKEFQVGEYVYLCIKPKKSSLRIGSCVKLAPRYCGPFEILERIRPVAYRLALPPTVKFHDVFHISLLENYIKDVDHVIDWSVL